MEVHEKNISKSKYTSPFKKGDFIYIETKYHPSGSYSLCIFDKIHEDTGLTDYLAEYNTDDSWLTPYPIPGYTENEIKVKRLATDDEKEKLLKRLRESGYMWDIENIRVKRKNIS